MPLLLIPIAAAGYAYWDKQRKQKLAEDGTVVGEVTTDSGELVTIVTKGDDVHVDGDDDVSSQEFILVEGNEDAVEVFSEDTMETSIGSNPKTPSHNGNPKQEQQQAQQQQQPLSPMIASWQPVGYVNPLAKFRTFCNNLEKEFEKARVRKELEAQGIPAYLQHQHLQQQQRQQQQQQISMDVVEGTENTTMTTEMPNDATSVPKITL